MVKVIALISPDKSGKDTFYKHASRIAVEEFGFKEVIRVSYADYLKEEVAQAVEYIDELSFNTDRVDLSEYYEDSEKKEQIRDLLKAWAMMRRILYDESYWSKRADSILQEDYPHKTLLVFTDMSYKDEQDRVKELIPQKDRLFIRINRIDSEYILPDPNAHSSNWGRFFLKVNAQFDNNKTPECMDNIVRESLQELQEIEETYAPDLWRY